MGDLSPFQALCHAAGTSTPDAAVVGAAQRLLRKCGQTAPPVALRPLLDELDVRFRWGGADFASGEGVASLDARGGDYRIIVHEEGFARTWRRTRFTIAHELSHVLIARIVNHPDLIAQFDADQDNHKQLERLCNVGAAELLMPRTWFRAELRARQLNSTALQFLYDRFLVSREALIWRIGELIPRGGVSRWRRYARTDAEPVQMRVVANYPPYARGTPRPWLPEGATARHAIGLPDVDAEEVPSEGHRIDTLIVELGKSKWQGSGAVLAWPRRASQRPMLGLFEVPDEPAGSWDSDLLLFAAETGYFGPSATVESR